MTRIQFPTLNLNRWASYLPTPLQKLDWRVAAAIGVAFAALVAIALRMRPSNSSNSANPSSTSANLSSNPANFFQNAVLDFPQETLKKECRFRYDSLPDEKHTRYFGDVLAQTLKLLDRATQPGTTEIILDRHTFDDQSPERKLFQELRFLGFGKDKTIYDASPSELDDCWFHQILQKLREKNYIASFEIKRDPNGLIITKR